MAASEAAMMVPHALARTTTSGSVLPQQALALATIVAMTALTLGMGTHAPWAASAAPSSASPSDQPQHSSNWAVLVSTSRYWLNYRHSANVMSMYRILRRLGYPDSNIILMLSDDHACNPRNPFKGTLFSNESHATNVYGDEVEVDYRGYEVTVDNLLRVLTGRHDAAVPRTKRLMSDSGSNVVVYLTGHGGDQFLKFQDTSQLMAQDLADAVAQMAEKQRFGQMFIMVESCEAFTQVQLIQAPGVIAVGSSIKDESSFAYKNDYTLGQSVIDRFTHLTLHFADALTGESKATLQDLMGIYSYDMMESHIGLLVNPGVRRPLSGLRVTDFLGSVASAHLLKQAYPLRRRRRHGANFF